MNHFQKPLFGALLLVLSAASYLLFTVCFPYIYALNVFKTEAPKNVEKQIISADTQSDPSQNTFKIAVIGDSTALGQGGGGAENSFSYQYAKKYLTEKHPKIEYSNFAISGARIEEVLANQANKVIQEKYDLIFVSLGANNVTDLKSDKTSFNIQVKLLTEKLSQTKSQIIWVSIPDFISSPILLPPLNFYLSSRTRDFNVETQQVLSSYNIELVDIYNQTRDEFKADPEKYFARDKYHPSAAGYQLWAEVIRSSISAN